FAIRAREHSATQTLRQRSFEDAEKIEREDEDNDAERENEIGVGELKSPPCHVPAGRFQRDEEQRERDEPDKNSGSEGQPAAENFRAALTRLFDEAENLERD